MVSVILWLGLATLLFVYALWSRRKFYMLMRKLGGPWGYPIMGMAHKFRKREVILQSFYEYEQIYGSLFCSWLGPIPFLVVCEPQIAQEILISPACVNKALVYDAVNDSVGRGLFSLKNPDWSFHRRHMNPAFGHNVLLSFLPIFNREVNVLLDDLDSVTGHGEMDLTPVIKKFTLNLAIRTTMGSTASSESESIHSQKGDLLESYKIILEKLTTICFHPWLQFRVIHWLLDDYKSYAMAQRQIRKFLRNLIHEKLEVLSSKQSDEMKSDNFQNEDAAYKRKDNKNAFIDIAIDLVRKGEFTWKNVEDESNVIVFAAFETTSTTIFDMLLLLAMFPKYQEKMYEEIRALFPKRDGFDVTYEDTQHMVYTDMVLNETMRLLASVPLVGRQTTQEVKLSNGIVLPKGLQIVIDIFNMHRRTDIWGPEAKTFNPENFLPSNMAGKHPYAFIPFTKGIRNCIGWHYALLSIKVTMARLIRKYRFTTTYNFQELQFVEDITLKFHRTPLLEFHLRES